MPLPFSFSYVFILFDIRQFSRRQRRWKFSCCKKLSRGWDNPITIFNLYLNFTLRWKNFALPSRNITSFLILRQLYWKHNCLRCHCNWQFEKKFNQFQIYIYRPLVAASIKEERNKRKTSCFVLSGYRGGSDRGSSVSVSIWNLAGFRDRVRGCRARRLGQGVAAGQRVGRLMRHYHTMWRDSPPPPPRRRHSSTSTYNVANATDKPALGCTPPPIASTLAVISSLPPLSFSLSLCLGDCSTNTRPIGRPFALGAQFSIW